MARPAPVDAMKVMGRMTMHVKVRHFRQLRIRLKLGCWLIGLAARVMGCGVEISKQFREAPE